MRASELESAPGLGYLQTAQGPDTSGVLMRFALSVLALILSIPAQAGGVGVLFTGGTHTEKMWFHSNIATADSGETVLLTDPDDFEKFETIIQEESSHQYSRFQSFTISIQNRRED